MTGSPTPLPPRLPLFATTPPRRDHPLNDGCGLRGNDGGSGHGQHDARGSGRGGVSALAFAPFSGLLRQDGQLTL